LIFYSKLNKSVRFIDLSVFKMSIILAHDQYPWDKNNSTLSLVFTLSPSFIFNTKIIWSTIMLLFSENIPGLMTLLLPQNSITLLLLYLIFVMNNFCLMSKMFIIMYCNLFVLHNSVILWTHIYTIHYPPLIEYL